LNRDEDCYKKLNAARHRDESRCFYNIAGRGFGFVGCPDFSALNDNIAMSDSSVG
jgi:hypothetical protein